MKRAWFSVFMFGFLSLTSPANAGFDSGNDVWEKCTSQKQFDQGMCYGLISGYFDSVQMAHTCPKAAVPDITRGQIRDIVVKFLKDNPGERHLLAATLAYRASKRPLIAGQRPTGPAPSARRAVAGASGLALQ